MRWAKATLTFMYDLDDLAEIYPDGVTDEDLSNMASEDAMDIHDWEWEIERFEG